MLDQQNKVMMSYGKFQLNQDTRISTQRQNIQSSENYAKMVMLTIVDPNVAGFMAVLQNEVNEGHSDALISQVSEDFKNQLKTHFDKIKEVNTQAKAVCYDAFNKAGINIQEAVSIGYKFVDQAMKSLATNNFTVKQALEELNNNIKQNREKYINTYTKNDVDRIQLIYSDPNGDRIIDQNDGINSIDAIPNITGEQKDLLKQIFDQCHWSPFVVQSTASCVFNRVDNQIHSPSGSTAKIIQTEEGSLKVVLYGVYDLLNADYDEYHRYSPPVSVTRTEVDLSNVQGDRTVNLASVIDLSVSAKTYYFDPKLKVHGCKLEKAYNHAAETLKECCDISQKKTTHGINSAIAKNFVSQEEANQEILKSLTKHLKYFKCLYYGQNDKLKSLDLVIEDITNNGDLAYATGLICYDGDICNLSLEKIDIAANKIRINCAKDIYGIIKQNQGRQNYSTLLQQVEQSTIDNLDILCTDDNQREILEKNAKQFARICLYELGELKFGQHPLECIIMLINKFFDYIMEDKMEEIMVGSKTENAKSFSKMVTARRLSENDELQI